MASGGNRHPDADFRESTERQEAIRTMFVNLHAIEQKQSPGQRYVDGAYMMHTLADDHHKHQIPPATEQTQS